MPADATLAAVAVARCRAAGLAGTLHAVFAPGAFDVDLTRVTALGQSDIAAAVACTADDIDAGNRRAARVGCAATLSASDRGAARSAVVDDGIAVGQSRCAGAHVAARATTVAGRALAAFSRVLGVLGKADLAAAEATGEITGGPDLCQEIKDMVANSNPSDDAHCAQMFDSLVLKMAHRQCEKVSVQPAKCNDITAKDFIEGPIEAWAAGMAIDRAIKRVESRPSEP